MKSWPVIAVLLIVAALLAACSPPPTPTAAPSTAPPPTAAPPTAPPPTAARPAALRLEAPDDPDVGDLPRLMAIEALEAEGYTIEHVSLNDTAATIIAVERGDLHFASISSASGWTAISEGATLLTVLDDTANTSLLAARAELTECADLDGARVGIANTGGTNSTLLYRYVASHCPEAQPEYLVVSGSSSRMAALLAGELDATIMDLFDLVGAERRQPGAVHALVTFAEEYPGLGGRGLFTQREFARQYPQAVRDVIRATLEARRAIQDPQALAEEIEKRLDMEPADAQQTAALFLERDVWDVNGYFSAEAVQENLDFLAESGGVPEGMAVGDVADFSYLEEVLAEIGRQ